MDPVSIRLLDKRYRITNMLGERMREYHYDARHVELDIPVHIVTLNLPSSAPTAAGDASIAHLWALAARATSLRHPSLVRVRDCFLYRRTFSIVTERVAGESLAGRIARRGRLSLRECLTYGLQLCDLLAYVAREGAALSPFLRITPESLVIQEDDRIILTDLGAGYWLYSRDDVDTADRLPYLAPEVLRGGAAPDGRAVVYSVAAVLYTALTGEPPAPAGQGLLPLSELAPLAPAALCATIERALQADPAARFATPEAFGHALGHSVYATMPAVVALAKQPRRRSTTVTVAQALASTNARGQMPAAPVRASARVSARRWPRQWAHDLSRVTAPRPLRRTGERALAAISSAFRLGA